uniref:Very-long-chain 3-oxoacyl-CoA reductase-like n=1 Tax=Diabrotica virgifera virgifera TaxID=50390 RepID=A0A6P7GUP1_DIAVI
MELYCIKRIPEKQPPSIAEAEMQEAVTRFQENMCYSFGLIVLIFVMPDSIRNIVQMCRALLAASFISNEKTSLAKKFGPWALITGCTDGIGKAYAFGLAKRGINIVLVSRNEEKLKKTAQDIVNNVGKLYDYPMYLSEVPEKDLFDMININVVPVTLLCGAFIGDMKKRGRGAIVNVSSGSEMFPLPLMTVYSATKVGISIILNYNTITIKMH